MHGEGRDSTLGQSRSLRAITFQRIRTVMGKRQIDPNAPARDQPYDLTFFAQKHGIELEIAGVIQRSNDPSRLACDAAALAFNQAMAIISRRWQHIK
jgi:hypothetical protein